MDSRKKLVTHLVEFDWPVSKTMMQLREYGWDCDEELVILTPEHVEGVLNRFLSKEINDAQVREWANAIEGRDDIGLLKDHSIVLDEMIFWLANPYINYPITEDLAKRVIGNLKTNSIN